MEDEMVKRIFLVFSMALSGFISAEGLNAINDPVMNPCIQRPDLAGCGANGSSASRRVINIPNRWGAIYFNPANRAIGYSENNTEGYQSANKEALESCIRAGGGANPIARDGKGCRLMIKYRNVCAAAAVGGQEGTGGYAMKNADYVKEAEEKALAACGKYSNECTIRYSGCSRHPDYLRY
jgi:hypothetical protein